jgi:selenocysteine lyase/cysteine desulfurase
VNAQALREQFPIFEHTAYLNAGTDGPLARVAADAGAHELAKECERGRVPAHFDHRQELGHALRGAYAQALGCSATQVALTTCTSEGLAVVIEGLTLGTGDEILTSDEEHPGLLGVLAAVRERRGVHVRTAPFLEICSAVGSSTRLVACSHVSWISGSLAPAELAQLEIPVLLDGAQGVGAMPCDVAALGCAAYAGAGQKWLCGPDGTGMLYVRDDYIEQIEVNRRGYGNLADPGSGLDAQLHADARRFDALALSAEAQAAALAAIQLLERAGWAGVHERARCLAERFAHELQEHGRSVAPRGASTLVSFSSNDPMGERARLAEHGVVVRDIPNHPLLRASVGAWNDERDLQRLLAALD